MMRDVLVIARRDFVATVFRRGFLIWLLMPVAILSLATGSALIGSGSKRAAQTVTVLATPGEAALLEKAAARLEGLGAPPLPLRFEPASDDPDRQARRVLTGGGAAVLVASTGRLYRPAGARVPVERLQALIDGARLIGGAADARPLAQTEVPLPAGRAGDRAKPVATAAAAIIFMLIGLLAGVLLTNMVEEKSNKVIEILASAAPVPAIFAGKLLAMLAIAITGVALWASLAGGLAAVAVAHLPAGAIPAPAVGWPMMLALGGAYFIAAFLLYGAIYLGIGSLCSSMREVQSLSMPVTLGQTMVFVFVINAIDSMRPVWLTGLSLFPLSSPYMMAARAALEPGLGRHALALAWQLGWAALAIWASARMFRRGVLQSGPPPSLFRLFRRSRA